MAKVKWIKIGDNDQPVPISEGETKEQAIARFLKEKEIESKYNTDETQSERELRELMGKEFKGYKGQDAIEKLMQEKQGHIKGAFHRSDIGDIDLWWGNERLGLCHIIRQRMKEKKNYDDAVLHTQRLLNNISETIEKGKNLGISKKRNYEIVYEKNKVVIAPEYHGYKVTYLLTAFEREK